METSLRQPLVTYDIPLFFAEITWDKHRTFLTIPPHFRMNHMLTNGLQQKAWMTLAGLPGKIWPCTLIPLVDDYIVVGGWPKFLRHISAGQSHLRLIFQFHSTTMTFVVTRFDSLGHLLRSPPDLRDCSVTPSIDGLDQLKEEYVHNIGTHNWYPVDERLIIIDGPFLHRLREAGIPSSYNFQLDTHRDIYWTIQVQNYGLQALQFHAGWAEFAHQTGLNSSHCIKLRLLECRLITAVIFHRRKGHLFTPVLSNPNPGSSLSWVGSYQSTSTAGPSNAGPSISHAPSSPIGTLSAELGAVDVPDCPEPYVIGRVWQMQVHDLIFHQLPSFPTCTMIVYDTFAYLPQGFIHSQNIALRKDVFLFQSFSGVAMLLKLTPHCETLFVSEGYPAFKQHFQLTTNSPLSLHMVGNTHFVFNGPA